MADLTPKDVCVLIPAYNEEKNVTRVVESVRQKGFEAVVVDDGSSDGTAEAARAAGAEVLRSERNRGKGYSLRLGFERCLVRGFAAVVTMDADGQHDSEELASFLEALNRGSEGIVVGTRMDEPHGMPRARRTVNRLLSAAISVLARQRVPDSQCGYRAVRADLLRRMRLRTTHYEIESEMLLEASRLGFRIGSVPVRSVYEGAKSEIHPVCDTLRFFKFLFRYYF